MGNLKAMDSDVFAQKYMNRSEKIGVPPIESLNTWGGSLAMGHPFSATGVRLLMHAANRLIYEDKRFAVISACAIGGQVNNLENLTNPRFYLFFYTRVRLLLSSVIRIVEVVLPNERQK